MAQILSAVDLEIAKRLKARRRLLGLGQDKVAEVLGVCHQQVQKYEAGKDKLSASQLFQVAGFFGVSLLYFFNEEGGKESDISSIKLIHPILFLKITRNLIKIKCRKRLINISKTIEFLANEK